MKCAICKKETNASCICGFCPECIIWLGHEGCAEELKKREKIK